MNRVIDITTSTLATIARAACGMQTGELGARPEKPLELFEFEACPFCRKVREALSILDLDAIIYPCPKQGKRFRPLVAQRGGKTQFPYLVDPNSGKEMYESDQIVDYLFETYGNGRVPWLLSGGPLNHLSAGIASALRPFGGWRAEPSTAPEQPLELFSFEASPFCRIAREVLCSLELPYRLHNVAKGSPKRAGFIERSRKMMVPWLFDPNTGTGSFESAEIVGFLRDTYGADA